MAEASLDFGLTQLKKVAVEKFRIEVCVRKNVHRWCHHAHQTPVIRFIFLLHPFSMRWLFARATSHHSLSRSARRHRDAQDRQPSWPWDPPHTRSYWTSTWTGQRTKGNWVYFLSHDDFVVFDASFNTSFVCESSGACLWAHMCAPQGFNYPVSDTQDCSDVIGLIIQWVLPSVCTPTVPDPNQSPPHTRTHTSKVLPSLSSELLKFQLIFLSNSLTHTHTHTFYKNCVKTTWQMCTISLLLCIPSQTHMKTNQKCFTLSSFCN